MTKEEEAILRGEKGPIKAKALEVVVKVGDVLKADRLVEIETAHIAGVSYFTIGEAGVEFLEELAKSGAKVSTFTTANPIGTDLGRDWGLPEDFVKGQMRIINALRRMGVNAWLSCTPYEALRLKPRTYHAWSESNAVAFINAVYDAYTEKYPGPFTIFAAITGRAPRAGLLTFEGRIPTIIVKLERDFPIDDPLKAGVLGKAIAEEVGHERPYVSVRLIGSSALKSFLASYATYSPHAFMIIESITPNHEAYRRAMDRHDVITINPCEKLRDLPRRSDVDAVLLGCPHYGIEELGHIVRYFKSRNWPHARIPILISTSPYAAWALRDYIGRLRECNVHLLVGTCFVVSPIIRRLNPRKVAVESLKAAFYLKRLHEVEPVFCSGLECIEIAL